jgi:prefoldin alpha subunit
MEKTNKAAQKPAMDESKKQELSQKYMELQMLDSQIKQIQAQAQAFEAQVIEVEKISQSLDELGNVKPGTEIFVPVAQGIFAKAELKESKDLIVAVGGASAVSKPISGIKEMLTNQIAEIRKFQQEMAKQLEKLAFEADNVEHSLTHLLEGTTCEHH